MATRVWDTRVFRPETLRTATEAYRTARQCGLGFDAACRFTGYATETIRQKGKGGSPILQPGGGVQIYQPCSVREIWAGATRSGHKYAQGKHRGNYLRAGRRMVSRITLEAMGALWSGTVDKMQQEHSPELGWNDLMLLVDRVAQSDSASPLPVVDAMMTYGPDLAGCLDVFLGGGTLDTLNNEPPVKPKKERK